VVLQSPSPKIIAVFGSSGIELDSEAAEQAFRLGYLLAKAGFAICNGGYTGVMEACSRGAAEAGGEVIGVTCSVFSRRDPNPYLTREIQTQDLPERIATLMRLADAYVVLDGSIGTLAELFLAWNLLVTGWSKPLLVVSENLRQALEELQPYIEIEEKHLQYLTFLPTIESAVDYLRQHFEIVDL